MNEKKRSNLRRQTWQRHYVCASLAWLGFSLFSSSFKAEPQHCNTVISFSRRPHPCLGKVPPNTVNLFPNPQKCCLFKLKIDVYEKEPGAGELTWVDMNASVHLHSLMKKSGKKQNFLLSKQNLWNNHPWIWFRQPTFHFLFGPRVWKPHHHRNLKTPLTF